MLLKRGKATGERARGMERKKWEQSGELELKLLIGLGFKLGFFSQFPFFRSPLPGLCSPLPAPRSPLPAPRSLFLVSRFGNLPPGVSLAPGLSLALSVHDP